MQNETRKSGRKGDEKLGRIKKKQISIIYQYNSATQCENRSHYSIFTVFFFFRDLFCYIYEEILNEQKKNNI